MKKPARKYLYELPAMTEFTVNRRLYRTITALKRTVVNKTHKNYSRTVLDLATGQAVRMKYFVMVTIFQLEKFKFTVG